MNATAALCAQVPTGARVTITALSSYHDRTRHRMPSLSPFWITIKGHQASPECPFEYCTDDDIRINPMRACVGGVEFAARAVFSVRREWGWGSVAVIVSRRCHGPLGVEWPRLPVSTGAGSAPWSPRAGHATPGHCESRGEMADRGGRLGRCTGPLFGHYRALGRRGRTSILIWVCVPTDRNGQRANPGMCTPSESASAESGGRWGFALAYVHGGPS